MKRRMRRRKKKKKKTNMIRMMLPPLRPTLTVDEGPDFVHPPGHAHTDVNVIS